MNRAIVGAIAGAALLAAAAVFVFAATDRDSGPVFIEGGTPVTIDLVKEKLVAEGWTGVQAMRRGRFVMAMASKDGRTEAFVVDTRTGRLHQNDDDDDD
jgi:ABC-type sugar transport system substrate-binding protein